jgi:hypothetical protein
MSLIIFSDGTTGIPDEDGWIEEFDLVDLGGRELEEQEALPAAFIDIEPHTVVDDEVAELPERTAFVGPPRPTDLPVELIEQIADAVREWGER